MKIKSVILIIAFIEMAIGLFTIFGLATSMLIVPAQKPFNVFIFVLASAMISSILGFGILRLNDIARRLLIFFSGYIVLTKMLIFMGLLQFSGELITFIASPIKNIVSVGYHIFLVAMLNSSATKKEFYLK